MTETPLAGDFAPATDEMWEREVLKVLNRGRPEGKELTVDKAMARLRTTTVDGLTIEPLYTESTGQPLGYPAVPPYTRGSQVPTGAPDAWDIRQLHEDPDPATTKAAVLKDLERGATSVWLRVGPDAIPADQVASCLEGVLFDIAAVAVSSDTDQAAAAAALAEAWRNSGTDKAAVTGNLGLDGLGLAALTGAPADLSAHRAWVHTCLDEFPKATALTADVLTYHNAGAGDVDELAYAIATGVEYLRDLDDAGIDAATAFGQIEFRLAATANQFLTICKLRALRRLWARVGEVSDVPPAKRGAKIHAVTSWRMMSREDPWVNLLRGTIATFAAAVGGADEVTCLPFDTVAGLPTDFSRRIARNTQIIAAEESNIGRVGDPAGGSFYVEQLTDQIANAAWARFTEIEKAGGMAAVLAAGGIKEQIATVTAERRKRLATRKLPLTGVSMFPMRDEQPLERPARAAAQEFHGLQPYRDAQVFEELRDASNAIRETGGKPAVFLALLGHQRDFGGRQGFASNLLLVAGLDTPESTATTPEEIAAECVASGAETAILCSSAKVYAHQAIPVAQALKDAGIARVIVAGQLKEVGADVPEGLFDGNIYDGMDVVEFLSTTLDRMGAKR